MTYLLAGLLVGFFVAIPIGAAAILCINRSIQFGYKAGFYTGFGVALADFLYGIVAVFGLFAISGETLQNQPVLRLVGAFCIMFVGLRMMSKSTEPLERNLEHETAFEDAVTGFMITITNPMTLIAFIAALSYVNYLLDQISFIGSVTIVFGIFFGSIFWWCILSYIAIALRDKLINKTIQKINLTSGLLIFVFGGILVLSIKGF